MFNLFRKPKQPFEEFVSYVEPMMRAGDLLARIVQKANDLGLKGKKIKVLCRRNLIAPDATLLDSIWFQGER